ncbi:holin family protein [Ruegeria faecimaris]|uniref:holin family protein n=1 Tax=Ruegeria faecimaris TaxID=686389 RepID=UPI00232AE274|nr:holin family protein [Ruegeria faecimaris]
MGLISGIFAFLFGEGRNVVRETTEVFRENSEQGAKRDLTRQQGVLEQYRAEFERVQKSAFDRFMDGLNRLPRPAMALGTLGLFIAAMVDPLWFAARMQGIALVPEPLWWLLGVVVSFYFGARHQTKVQDLQREISATMTRTPKVMENIETLAEMRERLIGVADTGTDAGLADEVLKPDFNPALEDWRRGRSA